MRRRQDRAEPNRQSAAFDGDVVVFLIGMRVNTWWMPWRWLPVAKAMGPMLRELTADPDSGLLAYRTFRRRRETMLVQYWRSPEKLQEFAHAAQRTHRPAWIDFYRRAFRDRHVGIWHETYVVPAGQSESVYVNMPTVGLGEVSGVLPAEQDHRADRPDATRV